MVSQLQDVLQEPVHLLFILNTRRNINELPLLKEFLDKLLLLVDFFSLGLWRRRVHTFDIYVSRQLFETLWGRILLWMTDIHIVFELLRVDLSPVLGSWLRELARWLLSDPCAIYTISEGIEIAGLILSIVLVLQYVCCRFSSTLRITLHLLS